MQYRKPHPWDGGYAIPAYIMAEPPLRGVHRTKYRARRTIDTLEPMAGMDIPSPWKAGYAIPGYIRGEALGRGAHRTKYLPRRTVSTLVPSYLGDVPAGSSNDMIANFGLRGSEWIMRRIRRVPARDRKAAMKALLEHLEPGLSAKVSSKADSYIAKGYPPATALQSALAASMSEGLLNQLIRLGRGKPVSMGFWNPVTWVAKKVAGAGGKAAGFVEEGIDKLGALACGVVSSNLGAAAAAGGATAAGVPPQVGVKGAQVAQQACAGKPTAAPVQLTTPQRSTPAWLVPAAIGGGALILVLALRKK